MKNWVAEGITSDVNDFTVGFSYQINWNIQNFNWKKKYWDLETCQKS